MLRVATVCGTRPELIRLSEIIKKLDKYTNHIFVHTNQNFDYELNQIFFDQLKIRKPNYLLDVKSDTIGEQIGKIITQCENVLIEEQPEAILILGDTNSALSCIVAKRMKIPIFHMEAGNRCFDERVPEEINRRIVDHTSDVNICYTEHSRRNLLMEGLHSQDVYVMSSPLVEVYKEQMGNIESSNILSELKLEKDKYFLGAIHREENLPNLLEILNIFSNLAEEYDMPFVFSSHPRTEHTIKSLHDSNLFDIEDRRIVLHKPFGMFDFIKLQMNAFCTLSDSGTIHEEAAILNIPAINVRESNERPEAYDSGNVIMSGIYSQTIYNAVKLIRGQVDSGVKFSNPYGEETNCSDRVVRLIIGLSKIMYQRAYG